MATSLGDAIKTQWRVFLSDRWNIYMLILVLMIPVVYESLRFMPVEESMTPHTFSPALTIWLQERLGTDGLIAYAASYYYVIPHILLMAGLGPLFLFAKRRPAWVYLSMALAIFILDSVIYVLYPVAPPVRLDDSGVVPIRINLFALSETTITAHYSAIPSGHIFTTVLGFLIAWLERWRRVAALYAANTIIMTGVIVYLGDHYFIDAVASLVLVGVVYAGVWGIARRTPQVQTRYGETLKMTSFAPDAPYESCAPRRPEA